MAANLMQRVKRLEQRFGSTKPPLIVRLNRFDAPDDAFSGIAVNQREFFARAPGETIAQTEQRIADLVSRRQDAACFVLKSVAVRPCKFVEELPE